MEYIFIDSPKFNLALTALKLFTYVNLSWGWTILFTWYFLKVVTSAYLTKSNNFEIMTRTIFIQSGGAEIKS